MIAEDENGKECINNLGYGSLYVIVLCLHTDVAIQKPEMGILEDYAWV